MLVIGSPDVVSRSSSDGSQKQIMVGYQINESIFNITEVFEVEG